MIRAGLPGSLHCAGERLLDLHGGQNARQGKSISLVLASHRCLFFTHFNRLHGLGMIVCGGRPANRRGSLGCGSHAPTPRRQMRLSCPKGNHFDLRRFVLRFQQLIKKAIQPPVERGLPQAILR